MTIRPALENASLPYWVSGDGTFVRMTRDDIFVPGTPAGQIPPLDDSALRTAIHAVQTLEHELPELYELALEDVDTVTMSGLIALGMARHKRVEDIDAIVHYTWRAAMAFQRILLWPAEEHAKRGIKTKRAASAGGRCRMEENEKFRQMAEQRRHYQPEVDRLVLEKRLSYNNACKIAAKTFHVSESTIKRYTSNPRPRISNKK
jgi:hypothetical protein